MPKKTTNRGGAREGAGRPAKYDEPTAMIAAKVPKSVIAKMDAYAERHGMNRTEVIILAINRLKLPDKKAE